MKGQQVEPSGHACGSVGLRNVGGNLRGRRRFQRNPPPHATSQDDQDHTGEVSIPAMPAEPARHLHIPLLYGIGHCPARRRPVDACAFICR